MNKIIEKNFKIAIKEIKDDIKNTQVKTVLQANSNLIMLYYRIGKIMFDNSKYGNSFIKNVATEIKIEFPSIQGFSERNLRSMKLFYLEYKNDKNWQQLVAKLPWGHNILLIQKIKNKDIRMIYIKAVLSNGWSRNILDFQIKTEYHKRIGKIMFDNYKYGNKFIDEVSRELKFEFPSIEGFSVRNLKYMKKFYLEYRDDELMQRIVAQLSWRHNIVLMNKIKENNIRKLYAEATIKNG